MSNEDPVQRTGIPVFLDRREPVIHDPAADEKLDKAAEWWPANSAAIKLSICLEAMRDTSVALEDISRERDPASAKRRIKRLATPLNNLGDGILELYKEIRGNPNSNRESLTEDEIRILRDRSKAFRASVYSTQGFDLKAVRNKMDAHVDDEMLHSKIAWEKISLPAILRIVRNCALELHYLLALDVYAWSYCSHGTWTLMSCDGVAVELELSGDEIKGILSVTEARSPKYAISDEIEALIGLYNVLAQDQRI